MTATVLVTGGTGFIGGRLVRRLVASGAGVRCLVRPGADTAALPAAVEIRTGSLVDEASIAAALDGVDVVYQIAGVGLRRLRHAPTFNEESTATLTAACLGARTPPRLLHLGTIKVAHPGGPTITEATPYGPTDPYGRAKMRCEQLVAAATRRGLRATIVRAPAVFGPGDCNFVPLFRAVQAGWLPLFSDPATATASAVYVDDLVETVVALAAHPAAVGRTVLVARYQPTSWNEFARAVAAGQPGRVRRLLMPSPLRWATPPLASALAHLGPRAATIAYRLRDMFCHRWVCSAEYLHRELGIMVETPLAAAIAATWPSMRQPPAQRPSTAVSR